MWTCLVCTSVHSLRETLPRFQPTPPAVAPAVAAPVLRSRDVEGVGTLQEVSRFLQHQSMWAVKREHL